MSEQWLQFLFSGITVGAIYALVGLGFTIIHNASGVVNFAQGEFVMVGAMVAISAHGAGAPVAVAFAFALVITVLVGLALHKLAIERAAQASVVTLIIITIGASVFIRGAALLVWGKDIQALPAFSGEVPITLGGATLLPQNLWVLGGAALLVVGVWFFFRHSLTGKAFLACADNPTAAALSGIPVANMQRLAYGLSAFLGAAAGVLITPITFTTYDAGLMLGLKGFAAAILGGMASPMGAVAGGLTLGVLESFGAGLISSGHKDAIAFALILFVLILRPQGLFGVRGGRRV
ncbi:MAG: branched-chain amino acid ABC transporter permease [Magnetococcus sp. WYHC-3]